ncbi:MAG: FAD-dependent oxidoreductase [Dehalococcoidales bacterium]|nr:FAD-dependent oxidoreductase [Dehalococcoidales bacterium]
MSRKIQEPIEIKGMKLKNRIAFAPFLNMPRNADWSVNDLTIRWFEERAKGGLGFIMTGSFVPLMVLMPTAREGFVRLAERMHQYDCKIGIQIVQGGPMSGQGPSPSPYPSATHAKLGQFDLMAGSIIPTTEVTVEYLEQQVKEFAAAAKLLKETGIDCVELHCAHGGATLCCSFISPFYNHRTDQYGGSWENRLRLPTDILRAMREAVGDDYPLFARMDADELLGDEGITVSDAQKYIAPALVEAGADCLDVSQGSIVHSPHGITIPVYYERGCFIENAAAIKEVVDVPVIGVGSILDMDMAERFLQEGKADIIYMGRQVTCDTDTPNKYFEGRPEDIRMCIGCQAGCGRPCAINYDIQDDPIPLTPAEKTRKVLVLGGGVAGMEAARIAATRGHQVTLFEKSSELGGMVANLGLNPLTGEFGNVTRYLSTQMGKLGVDVRVCKDATADEIVGMKPDVVILAAGSTATIPDVAEGKFGVLTHGEALRQRRSIGQKVVVWGFFGAELAIALAEEGKDVILMGRSGEGSLGSDIAGVRRFYLVKKLTDLTLVRGTPEGQRMSNPEVLYNVTVEEIADGKITLQAGDNTDRKRVIPYDTIILSRRFGERKSNDFLFSELEGKLPEVYKIGDCAQVRTIKDAIWTANEVARKI